MSIWEDFKAKYVNPRVENVTVGFSGIDPDEKGSSLSDEQLRDLILACLANITIKIDSGNIDPAADEPIVQPVAIRPSEIPHEQLGGLLGGNEQGHYHLTDTELGKLRGYPEYEAIRTNIEADIKHEQLPDLQGGQNGQHYHLTSTERQKLGKLITTFIPANDVVIPEDDHEKLKTLLGGEPNKHYHLTADELYKLQKILDLLFPDGATEHKLPSSPSGGGEDDTPGGGSSGEIFGGLPSVEPPAWEIHNFPNYNNKTQYSAYNAVHTMYYGKSCAAKDGTPKIGLHVLMEYGNSSNCGMVFTQNLQTWTFKEPLTKKNNANKGISQYLAWDTGVTSSTYRKRLFIMLPGRTSMSNPIRFLYGENTSGAANEHCTSQQNVKSTTPYVACCQSPSKSMALFVSSGGNVARFKGDSVLKKETYSCGISVNPGCVAWSDYAGVFCVTGPDGTATSTDGSSWTKYTTAPKNLVDLVYREDLPGSQPKGFFARGTDKLFYASSDGKNWSVVSTAAIPLSTVAAVAYAPELGWYCAIGGTSKYAWFSKDLTAWVSTKVSSSDVPMGSVIWMPSTNRFVLMPTEGTSYYTFNPANWG